MKEDQQTIIPLHDCTQQEKDRRKVVLKSAARVIQQSSWELLVACMTCLVVVGGSAILILVTVVLLEHRVTSPLAQPHRADIHAPHLSFVSLGEDCDSSPRCRCAVVAAARRNPHLACHVYNIVDDRDDDNPPGSGLDELPNVHLHYNSSAKYFRDSPLDGWWSRAPQRLKVFAARVLALWRHGGASLDDGLVALGGGTIVANFSDNAVLLDVDRGRVLGSPAPCHAFLFELMRALKRAVATSDVRDVIVDTLRRFCVGSARCAGVKAIPREVFCDHEAGGLALNTVVEEGNDLIDTATYVIPVVGKKNSMVLPRQQLLVDETEHVDIRKHKTCRWATMNDELLRQMCPAS